MDNQPKKRGWWKRRSRMPKLGITVVVLIVVLSVIIAAAAGCGTKKASSSTTATTVATAESTTTALSAATTAASQAAGSAATTLTTEAATTTSEAVTTTSAEAATTTTAAGLELSIAKVTSPVPRGSSATLTAKTAPGADCSIDVEYSSGPSTAQGLGPKKANSAGNVSWTWKVGSRTASGTYTITVTASKGGQSATKDISFTVK